jgi:UDP-N-acetylglucosamine 2-epimerase (non-hydrolysing)
MIMDEIYFLDGSLEKFVERVLVKNKPVHLVFCGTKPDLIKQAPILQELLKRGENAFLVHTGQHYDENLSGGIEKEFGLKVDVNLKVSGGSLSDNFSKIIYRMGNIFAKIREENPEIPVLPYVHGDTATCFASSVAGFAHGYPSVHIEAGIRTLMIEKSVLEKFDFGNFSFEAWQNVCENPENFTRGSHEPFPEQFNTRSTEAGVGLFMSPIKLVTESLKAEGYPASRIFTVGNSIVDAVDFADEIKSDIFEKFPKLENGFVRVCVHRRENTQDEKRFVMLFEMIEKLVKSSPKPVLWILLPGTKQAIKKWGLEDRLAILRENENAVISDVWPKYSDVIAAMKHCAVCATDSGSMQEEMNGLKIPCVTLRYGSDRPETFFAKSNILCPFVGAENMEKIILESLKNSRDFEYPNIYGENVSQKIVDNVLDVLANKVELLRLNP